MHADGIQTAIVEYARLRERSAPQEPPRPWKDLTAGEMEVGSGAERRPAWRRFGLFCAAAGAMAAATWLVLPREPKMEPKQPAPAAAMEGSVERRPAAPKAAAAKRPEASAAAGAQEELEVVAALHGLEADLGEPIELERSGGRLTLKALGVGAERRRGIEAAMRRFAGLRMEFAEPVAEGPRAGAEGVVLAGRRPVAFEAKLLEQRGSKRALEQFTNAVLDGSDRALARAYALRKLEERFADGRGLDANDRELLARIRSDHRRALAQAAEELEHSMAPVFQALDIAARPAPPLSLLETARRMDRLLNAALAGAHSDLSDSDLYAELRGWLARLRELAGA